MEETLCFGVARSAFYPYHQKSKYIFLPTMLQLLDKHPGLKNILKKSNCENLAWLHLAPVPHLEANYSELNFIFFP